MKSDTLQLNRPLGKIFWLTIILLIFLGGVAEWITRLESFQAPLTPPKMGSRHYQLGHKLALLDAEVKRNGPIDCVMVGSSMVDVGFNPNSYQTGYHETAGRDIRCFNFGIDASSAVSTAALVKILVEDYHPRILIFGTDPRDYGIASDDRDPAVILNTSWVQYRQGDFSVEGWLLDHSYLFRYRQHLSRLMRFNFQGTLSATDADTGTFSFAFVSGGVPASTFATGGVTGAARGGWGGDRGARGPPPGPPPRARGGPGARRPRGGPRPLRRRRAGAQAPPRPRPRRRNSRLAP